MNETTHDESMFALLQEVLTGVGFDLLDIAPLVHNPAIWYAPLVRPLPLSMVQPMARLVMQIAAKRHGVPLEVDAADIGLQVTKLRIRVLS